MERIIRIQYNHCKQKQLRVFILLSFFILYLNESKFLGDIFHFFSTPQFFKQLFGAFREKVASLGFFVCKYW